MMKKKESGDIWGETMIMGERCRSERLGNKERGGLEEGATKTRRDDVWKIHICTVT